MQPQRAFRLTGAPLILSPGTPRDRVEILKEAFCKTYRDSEFHKEHKKLSGEEPTPLMPEDHERSVREIPREPELIELFNRVKQLRQVTHGGGRWSVDAPSLINVTNPDQST